LYGACVSRNRAGVVAHQGEDPARRASAPLAGCQGHRGAIGAIDHNSVGYRYGTDRAQLTRRQSYGGLRRYRQPNCCHAVLLISLVLWISILVNPNDPIVTEQRGEFYLITGVVPLERHTHCSHLCLPFGELTAAQCNL
jgi:hypothetical protein